MRSLSPEDDVKLTSETREQVTAHICSSINSIVSALNAYISVNKNKLLKNEKKRKDDVLFIVNQFYPRSVGQRILSPENLSKKPPDLFPLAKKDNLAPLGLQAHVDLLLDKFNNIRAHLEKIETGIRNGSQLRSGIISALQGSEEKLKNLKTKIREEEKLWDANVAEKNNMSNRTENTNFYRLPKDVVNIVFSFLKPRHRFQVCRVSQLFNGTAKEGHWKILCLDEFPFLAQKLENLKKDRETYCALFHRIKETNYLCTAIKEAKYAAEYFLHSSEYEIYDFRYSSSNRIMDIHAGLERGIKALRNELNEANERRDRILQEKRNQEIYVHMVMPILGRS